MRIECQIHCKKCNKIISTNSYKVEITEDNIYYEHYNCEEEDNYENN